MIPTNRPVIGRDLDAVRQSFGLLTADACWLFGISITRWMQIVRQNPEAPVKDPSLALLVRFLDQHPELSIIPKFPGPHEMFNLVNSVVQTDKKRFSVIFGSEGSAAYRWLGANSRQSPAVNRLMLYMKAALLSRPPEERVELMEKWRDTVEAEATSRGAQDVFKTCRWGPAPESKSPSEAKPKPPQEGGPGQIPRRGRKKVAVAA